MATLKPTTPLLTPNKGPLKPASPLHPKNAPKTPISHPQRRRWFQLAHLTGPQRRRWFQTTRPPGRRSQAAAPVGGSGAWPEHKPTHRASSAHQAPLVWRAPEGPEGTGGLRGAAPNEVRSPSLAGGRGLRRPEHPWVHTAARPHRGRAAQQVSEAHRRITTMSGSPRPLSWRTLEIPSLAAISFAVPSMRGSS